MAKYHQLTREQRYHIHGMLQSGSSQVEIAASLDVHKSTISRELKRNRGQRGWRPEQAHQKALAKGSDKSQNASKIRLWQWEIVERLLCQNYSPEQVAGRIAREESFCVGRQSIYLHIYEDKKCGGELWKHLRSRKQRKRRYGSGREKRQIIKNRIGIEDRPAIVETRERIGDWEGDTIVGKSHKGAIVTNVERRTLYLVGEKLPSKQAHLVTESIVRTLAPYKEKVFTHTFDNGTEFTGHQEIAKALDAQIYFAHPYSSWERGSNENTNGLLRQYFPKGTDFSEITNSEVAKVVKQLNHRPRKVLGYKSPHEVFFGVEMCYV
jgi:IS30 family transposase